MLGVFWITDRGFQDHVNIRILQNMMSGITPKDWNQNVRSLCSYYTNDFIRISTRRLMGLRKYS